jgi:phenylalanyl-tRNA synthetase beta chain
LNSASRCTRSTPTRSRGRSACAARAGETLKFLDEREVALDDGFLLITDADRPVAGRSHGGYDTRVTTQTRNVFLEAAHFAPAALAGRARKLGMHTDAAHRFERGVDAELPRRALERATKLILDAAGGSAGAIVEAVSREHLPVREAVLLRRARIERLLGIASPTRKSNASSLRSTCASNAPPTAGA